jgi:hypothetical protein
MIKTNILYSELPQNLHWGVGLCFLSRRNLVTLYSCVHYEPWVISSTSGYTILINAY